MALSTNQAIEYTFLLLAHSLDNRCTNMLRWKIWKTQTFSYSLALYRIFINIAIRKNTNNIGNKSFFKRLDVCIPISKILKSSIKNNSLKRHPNSAPKNHSYLQKIFTLSIWHIFYQLYTIYKLFLACFSSFTVCLSIILHMAYLLSVIHYL